MARPNVLFGGFQYFDNVYGQSNPKPRRMQVATAYGTAIFCGDPVKKVNDGSVSIAAAGEAIYGIVSAVHYLTTAGVYVDKNYVPASIAYTADRTRTIVDVIVAYPGIRFKVCADAAIATVATARTYVDENVDHVATAAGNTGTGRSGYQIAIAGHQTATAQWRLSELLCGDDDPTNDPTQANHYWIVEANETHNLPGAFSATGI